MLRSTHPSKSRLSLGRQHIACYVIWAAFLSAVALRTLYFTHFKLFYFPNVIGLVQRIVRFVMRTELKASYRTVQYEYAYRYTSNIHIYIYVCVCVCKHILYLIYYKSFTYFLTWLNNHVSMHTNNSVKSNIFRMDLVWILSWCSMHTKYALNIHFNI